MLRPSLVDRVNGELADLLAGRSGSEQILLELEDANAFVVSLDAVEEALTDHHLDEVAEMIEQARADKPSSESPFSDGPAG